MLEAPKVRTRGTSGAAALYVESWKNRLKRIEQLVHNSIGTRDLQVEKQLSSPAVLMNPTMFSPVGATLGMMPEPVPFSAKCF